MRISKIRCSNFKSLVDFEVPLAKFSCLVGLNGSGKSTVLQFVDFLAQLMRGDITEWLREREWAASDLTSWRNTPGVISFRVEMMNKAEGLSGSWDGSFDTETLRCGSELLVFGSTRFEVNGNEFTASHGENLSNHGPVRREPSRQDFRLVPATANRTVPRLLQNVADAGTSFARADAAADEGGGSHHRQRGREAVSLPPRPPGGPEVGHRSEAEGGLPALPCTGHSRDQVGDEGS